MKSNVTKKLFNKIKAAKAEGLSFKNILGIALFIILIISLFLLDILVKADKRVAENDDLKNTAQLEWEGKYGSSAHTNAMIDEYGHS